MEDDIKQDTSTGSSSGSELNHRRPQTRLHSMGPQSPRVAWLENRSTDVPHEAWLVSFGQCFSLHSLHP